MFQKGVQVKQTRNSIVKMHYWFKYLIIKHLNAYIQQNIGHELVERYLSIQRRSQKNRISSVICI